jgi:hypothetical protein
MSEYLMTGLIAGLAGVLSYKVTGWILGEW